MKEIRTRNVSGFIFVLLMLLTYTYVLVVQDYRNDQLEKQMVEVESFNLKLNEQLDKEKSAYKQTKKTLSSLEEKLNTLTGQINNLLTEKETILRENQQLQTDLQKEKDRSKLSLGSVIKKTIYGVASAYTLREPGVTGTTASGAKVRPGMVAMDRSIPFGTKVRITSDAYPAINNVYIVADRGGAIGSNRVDIYMDSYHEAIQFGKRDVKIEFLN